MPGMAKPFQDHEKHPELAAFGQAVRRVRMEKGLSQEALADEAGLDRSYLGGIERGEHNLAMVNMVRISTALGIKLVDLITLAKL